jgi:2-haloacid dehalogenase
MFQTALAQALAQFGLPPNRLLQVAESLFHDIVPARELGFATMWVNRQNAEQIGASGRLNAKPDLMVQSLGELADLCLEVEYKKNPPDTEPRGPFP